MYFNDPYSGLCRVGWCIVSILIVMDVLQWLEKCLINTCSTSGLNPYCNGCTSMIGPSKPWWENLFEVSILIVMDVLQWYCWTDGERYYVYCLNPYCNGCTSMIPFWEFRGVRRFTVSILIVMDVLQWSGLLMSTPTGARGSQSLL